MSRTCSELGVARWLPALMLGLLATPLAYADDLVADAARQLRADALEQAAPDFDLLDLDGARVALSEYRGRPLVVHVWATWCEPCRYEMPALAQAAKQLGELAAFVAIDIDDDVPVATVSARAKAFGITFPVALARSGAITNRYWAWGLPVTYVIGSEGGLRWRFLGSRDWANETVQRDLAVLLAAAR